MNNQEKNTYVKNQITNALIQLLQSRPLKDISITEIVVAAGVGRASFYRNFSDKADILKQHAIYLTKKWGIEFESDPKSNPGNVFGSLFQHYKDNSNFYLLLYHNHLTDILLQTIKEVCGPASGQTNLVAYEKAFFAYGLYGWIMEWMERGMQESAEEMNALLATRNMK